MNPVLQNLLWYEMSLQVIEAIVNDYTKVSTKPKKEPYDLGCLHTFEGLFGQQNLKNPFRFTSQSAVFPEQTSMTIDNTKVNSSEVLYNFFSELEKASENARKALMGIEI